jgi:hypothetical protein
LKCDHEELFKPWDKSARGRFVDHPDIEILPEIKTYIGKVIYVIDDFITTGRTLQDSDQGVDSA